MVQANAMTPTETLPRRNCILFLHVQTKEWRGCVSYRSGGWECLSPARAGGSEAILAASQPWVSLRRLRAQSSDSLLGRTGIASFNHGSASVVWGPRCVEPFLKRKGTYATHKLAKGWSVQPWEHSAGSTNRICWLDRKLDCNTLSTWLIYTNTY